MDALPLGFPADRVRWRDGDSVRGGWEIEIVAACLIAFPCSAQRLSQTHWDSHVDHTPPGNTDLTAAIDDGYAAAIKWHMRVAQEIWLEDDENLWTSGRTASCVPGTAVS